MIEEVQEAMSLIATNTVSTPDDMADHNFNVGRMDAFVEVFVGIVGQPDYLKDITDRLGTKEGSEDDEDGIPLPVEVNKKEEVNGPRRRNHSGRLSYRRN
jgi:hypothetical protein